MLKNSLRFQRDGGVYREFESPKWWVEGKQAWIGHRRHPFQLQTQDKCQIKSLKMSLFSCLMSCGELLKSQSVTMCSHDKHTHIHTVRDKCEWDEMGGMTMCRWRWQTNEVFFRLFRSAIWPEWGGKKSSFSEDYLWQHTSFILLFQRCVKRKKTTTNAFEERKILMTKLAFRKYLLYSLSLLNANEI